MEILLIILMITCAIEIIITIILDSKKSKLLNEFLNKQIELIGIQERINWILLKADLTKESPAITNKKIKEVITSPHN